MMRKSAIEFRREEMKEMAVFIAELVRQGVTWASYTDPSSYNFVIVLTGGF